MEGLTDGWTDVLAYRRSGLSQKQSNSICVSYRLPMEREFSSVLQNIPGCQRPAMTAASEACFERAAALVETAL